MWIPKDERRLLAGLYRLIGEPGTREAYRDDSLGTLLDSPRRWRKVRQYGDEGDGDDGSCSTDDIDRRKRQNARLIHLKERVTRAVKVLESRNLIRFSPHQNVGSVVIVELTVEGLDLGRKYATFLERSGLWFREYRYHWLCMLLGYVACYATPFLIKLVGSLLDYLWHAGSAQ